MRKFKDFLTIIRPINSLMIGFAVIVGEVLALNSLPNLNLMILGFLTGFLISSSSMVFNDYFDLEVDRVNVPNRPLPSGRIPVRLAVIFGFSLGFIGCLIAGLIGSLPFLIAVLFWFVAIIYDWIGKKLGLIGNAMVSISVAIPYVFGGIAAGKITLTIIILSLISFLANMAREVVKGLIDVEGDRVKGYRTLALTRDEETVILTALAFIVTAITLSFTPYVLGEMELNYLSLISIADLIMVYAVIKMLLASTKNEFRSVKQLILVGMLLGLISFFIGGLTR